MNSTNNIEVEQTVQTAEEAQTPDLITPTEQAESHFGRDLSDYLRHLEEEFGPRAQELGDDKLTKVKTDLRQIEEVEKNPALRANFDPAKASESLLLVFQNMQAWERRMIALSNTDPAQQTDAKDRFYGSKKTFMTSCHTLYPDLSFSTSLSLAGSEVFKMERELAGINIGDIKARIQELPNLEALALEIDEKRETDPETAIHDLEAISTKISQGVDNALRKGDLTHEEQEQLNLCVEILYKIRILIDKIKDSEIYKKQKKSHLEAGEVAGQSKDKITAKPENPLESNTESNESLAQIEARWNVLFANDLGSMEDYLEDPSHRRFNFLNFDADKSQRLEESFDGVWFDFQADKRPLELKMTEYKLRLGQRMNEILG